MNHLYSNWCAIMHMIFKFNLETTCDSVTINPKADNDTSAMITSQTLVTKLPLEDVPVSGIMNAYSPYHNHSFHPHDVLSGTIPDRRLVQPMHPPPKG